MTLNNLFKLPELLNKDQSEAEKEKSIKLDLMRENKKLRKLSKVSDWTIIMGQREVNRLREENKELKSKIEKLEIDGDNISIENYKRRQSKNSEDSVNVPLITVVTKIHKLKSSKRMTTTIKDENSRVKHSDSNAAFLDEDREVDQLVQQLKLVKTRFEDQGDNPVNTKDGDLLSYEFNKGSRSIRFGGDGKTNNYSNYLEDDLDNNHKITEDLTLQLKLVKTRFEEQGHHPLDIEDDQLSYHDNNGGMSNNDSTDLEYNFESNNKSKEDPIILRHNCSVSVSYSNPKIRSRHLLDHVRKFKGVEDIQFDGNQAVSIIFSSLEHATFFSEQQHKI